VTRDRGSIAPAVPVIGLIILLVGGLVLDASRQLNARGRAVAYAEEAARAGASAVDLASPRLQLVPADVSTRVAGYCDAVNRALPDQGLKQCRLVGIEPAADGRPLVVVVHVEMSIPATLLGIVGVSTLTASGDGRARPLEGVDVGDAN
jgi:hypothetical protein